MGSVRVYALSGALLWALACAADAGDVLKTDSSGMVGTLEAGTGSSSGGIIEGDSSIVDEPGPAPEGDATTGLPPPPSDASTPPPVEASPPPPSCTTCPLTVEYYTRSSPPVATNTVRFDVSITNNGSMPQPLANLKVRYWFTTEGATSFAMNEYYAASPINGNVTGTFTPLTASTTPPATATANAYLEVSFGAAAGSIASMTSTNDIQLAFNDTTYQTNFNEANDYSYTAADSMGTCGGANNVITCQSMTVTLYRDGMLAWGNEPGGMQAATGDP
jgi:Cellulose binding domain